MKRSVPLLWTLAALLWAAPVHARSEVQILDLGPLTFEAYGLSPKITVQIPRQRNGLRAVSATLMVTGDRHHTYAFPLVADAKETLVDGSVDCEDFDRTCEEKYPISHLKNPGIPGSAALMVPASPTVPFRPGKWTVQVSAKPASVESIGLPTSARLQVAVKYADRDPVKTQVRGRLQVNVVVVSAECLPQEQLEDQVKASGIGEAMGYVQDYFSRPRYIGGKSFQENFYESIDYEYTDEGRTAIKSRSVTFQGKKTPIPGTDDDEANDDVRMQLVREYSRAPDARKENGIDLVWGSVTSVQYDGGGKLAPSNLGERVLSDMASKVPAPEKGITLLLVPQAMGEEPLNGIASGMPGLAPGVEGVGHVVATLIDREERVEYRAHNIAHEIGHILGLGHAEFGRTTDDTFRNRSNVMDTMSRPEYWKSYVSDSFSPGQMKTMLLHPAVELKP